MVKPKLRRIQQRPDQFLRRRALVGFAICQVRDHFSRFVFFGQSRQNGQIQLLCRNARVFLLDDPLGHVVCRRR